MNENAKKRLKSAGAVTLAAALLLTGTFAWSNSSSLLTNQAYGATNPGGRLHDDFDGTNKDIYVENFGSQNIYARVKLTEYMEIGSESYKNVDSTERNATSVVSTATLNDKTTWTNYFKKSDSADKDKIAEYFEWTTNGGKTVYMPTFNKNKDSYVSDVNGRYVNKVDGAFSYTDYQDGSHYTDYKVYAVDEEKEGFEIVDADDNTADELSEYMVTTAVNSADSDALKTNLGAYLTDGNVDANTKTVDDQAGAVTYEKVKHVAAETIEASAPITMETYNGYDASAKAAYVGWIIDEEDGWAYWSQKIAPNTATGLLLDSIGELKKSDGENWYYAIDAEAQFITVDDEWDGGNAASAPSDAAKTALGAMGLTKYKDKTTTPSEDSKDAATVKAAIKAVDSSKIGTADAVVSVDGVDFIVVDRDDDSAILLQKSAVKKSQFGSNNRWKGSTIETYLNSTESDGYLNGKTVLQELVGNGTEIKTAETYNRSGNNYVTTTDKVFLLSEADVFGTANKTATTTSEEFTNGTGKLNISSDVLATGSWWWLRSPRFYSTTVAIVDYDGTADSGIYFGTYDVRPAFSVNL